MQRNINWHPFGGFHSYDTLIKYTEEPATYGFNDRDGTRYSWLFSYGTCVCTVTTN